MTNSDIYEKIKELEIQLDNSIEDRHILIHADENYWYIKGQLDAYKSLVD